MQPLLVLSAPVLVRECVCVCASFMKALAHVAHKKRDERKTSRKWTRRAEGGAGVR